MEEERWIIKLCRDNTTQYVCKPKIFVESAVLAKRFLNKSDAKAYIRRYKYSNAEVIDINELPDDNPMSKFLLNC